MTLTNLLEVVQLNDTDVLVETKINDGLYVMDIDYNKDYSNYEVVSIKARNYLLIIEVI